MSRNTRSLVSTFFMLGPTFWKMNETRDTFSIPLAVLSYGVAGPHKALAAAVIGAIWAVYAAAWSMFVMPFALIFKKKAENMVRRQDQDAQAGAECA